MRIRYHLLLTFLLISPAMAANPLLQDFWQCTITDDLDKHWTFRHSFQKVALHKAWEACKKSSQQPASCDMAGENCDAFLNGQNTSPMWQCTALDQQAKAWVSSVYRQRDDAALAAKDRCLKHSGLPDTCYINLLTCVNLNERE